MNVKPDFSKGVNMSHNVVTKLGFFLLGKLKVNVIELRARMHACLKLRSIRIDNALDAIDLLSGHDVDLVLLDIFIKGDRDGVWVGG